MKVDVRPGCYGDNNNNKGGEKPNVYFAAENKRFSRVREKPTAICGRTPSKVVKKTWPPNSYSALFREGGFPPVYSFLFSFGIGLNVCPSPCLLSLFGNPSLWPQGETPRFK